MILFFYLLHTCSFKTVLLLLKLEGERCFVLSFMHKLCSHIIHMILDLKGIDLNNYHY